jgi:hypothetical protein
MPETQTVEISETGEVRITVRGVKGKSCKDATRQVEQALGKTVTSTPTSEYYDKEQAIAKH